MKLKWRNLPAFITLLAGFITCVITIIYRYPLNKMLWVLILVMSVFYIIGLSIRELLMHFVEGTDKKDEEKPEEDNENAEQLEEGEQAESPEDDSEQSINN